MSATGGTILFNDKLFFDGGLDDYPPNAQAGAFAAGMVGQSIYIENFSGDILATVRVTTTDTGLCALFTHTVDS